MHANQSPLKARDGAIYHRLRSLCLENKEKSSHLLSGIVQRCIPTERNTPNRSGTNLGRSTRTKSSIIEGYDHGIGSWVP